MTGSERPPLTPEQGRIVEWGEGPLVVVAGAGSGKTRVIVERVRWLLETQGHARPTPDGMLVCPEPPAPDPDAPPFAGPLLPEQCLVLTYNVKAAQELRDRLDATVGPAARSRMTVANFHAFCSQILAECSADAGLPPSADVLDGVGQLLLLRDVRPSMPLLYHAGGGNPHFWFDAFVGFINRAKDELVSPDALDEFAATERAVFERRYGSYGDALARLQAQGSFAPLRPVRSAYADLRRAERAAAAGDPDAVPDDARIERLAEREARRTVLGTGALRSREVLDEKTLDAIDVLAPTYAVDAAALEVLRLSELALVYRVYEEELARRGALDFGSQIALVIRLFERRPNLLRRYQRGYRYILVDEFQDANIAQIQLVTLLGRTPDRPDNVMVVGDDDQSIYRFRGASYAAFVEFDRRFAGPPPHDPDAPAAPLPARLRLEENHRSTPPVLAAANRLITRNLLRYAPDKVLRPTREGDEPVELLLCAGPDDEAAALVDRIEAFAGWDPAEGGAPAVPWRSFAVLYRKHRHREAIVERLKTENIPYTVVGGLSLFETAEIRDLEQSLRAVADPLQDIAVVRMLSAGPWRCDAVEILTLARAAKRARQPLIEIVRAAVAAGELTGEERGDAEGEGRSNGNEVAVTGAPDGNGNARGTEAGVALAPATFDLAAPQTQVAAATRPSPAPLVPLAPATRAKLRRFLATIDELTPRTWREGPLAILAALLERSGQVLDLVAVDTLEAKRQVVNMASLLRFAQAWEGEHPRGTLAAFVDYLDAYQAAGGELPTSVELLADTEGVQLMTLYQAKGLEFPYVFIPQLLEGEWPTGEHALGLFPLELLREPVPAGDVHTEEERRLLYVAMTRARERLVLSTHTGSAATKEVSRFVGELRERHGGELTVIDRVGEAAAAADVAPGTEPNAELDLEATAALRRVTPAPSRRERRLSLRLRANELLDLVEGIDPGDPEAGAARASLGHELAGLAASAARSADATRAQGLDPLTLRVLTARPGAGVGLFSVIAPPDWFSYSAFDAYERCPAAYAFRYLYRFPSAQAVGAFTFGTTAHAAFESFTKARRERLAQGEPPPTREDLARFFEAAWEPTGFPDAVTEAGFRRRAASLLDTFWQGELSTRGEVLAEEVHFELPLELPDGATIKVNGQIDRIDRLPSGGIELLDYKTGSPASQKSVRESLQLSIYALACRDALGYGTPERVTLYFTESGTRMSTSRTDAELDAARDDLVARVTRIRSGDFAATPSSRQCGWCDFASLCPSRVR